MCRKICVCVFVLILKNVPVDPLVIPEDVPAGLAAIYGFAPPLRIGNDNRIGFGFRFGNHADFQIMYEFGPQTMTKFLKPPKIRSAPYRLRFERSRRPFLALLLRTGFLKQISYYDNNEIKDCDDEPR